MQKTLKVVTRRRKIRKIQVTQKILPLLLQKTKRKTNLKVENLGVVVLEPQLKLILHPFLFPNYSQVGIFPKAKLWTIL